MTALRLCTRKGLRRLRRVSELEAYVAQLVYTINSMRADQQPTRQALKRHMAERQWLEEAVVAQTRYLMPASRRR